MSQQKKSNHSSSSNTYIQIEPYSELVFRETQNSQTPVCQMALTNISDFKVGFKIKTTQPQSYVVVPNQGVLNQGQKQVVQITILRMKQVLQEKNDKFLVQAVVCGQNNSNFMLLQKEDLPALFMQTDKKYLQLKRLNVKMETNPKIRNSVGSGFISPNKGYIAARSESGGNFQLARDARKSDNFLKQQFNLIDDDQIRQSSISGMQTAQQNDYHSYKTSKMMQNSKSYLSQQSSNKASEYTTLAAKHVSNLALYITQTRLQKEYNDLKRNYQKLRDNQSFHETKNKACKNSNFGKGIFSW